MKFRCLKKDIVKSIGVTENVVEGKVIYNNHKYVSFLRKRNGDGYES